MTPRNLHIVLLVAWLPVLVWSYIEPHDRGTWWLETIPATAGIALLAAIYRRFQLTTLAYVLVWIHATILLIGGHYTYAEVPFGNWLRDTFDLARNPYDRIGHFAQGFIPAILAREVFIRVGRMPRGGWLFFHVTCFCLAFSALYEIIEWWSAVAFGEGAAAFLGTQGDVWDAQWDMFTCLAAAVVAQLTLGCLHNRAMARMEPPK